MPSALALAEEPAVPGYVAEELSCCPQPGASACTADRMLCQFLDWGRLLHGCFSSSSKTVTALRLLWTWHGGQPGAVLWLSALLVTTVLISNTVVKFSKGRAEI